MNDISFHKVSWEQFEKDCLELAKRLKNKQIDKIVAISRGGLVAARILSDLLEVPISHITITSYQNLKQEKEPFIDETPSKSFHDETILIVDEICDTGKTFERALSYFRNFSLKHIYTLAPYLKSHATHQPDFWLHTIDAWIIFPYEVVETYKAFVHLYKDETAAKKKMIEVGFQPWELEHLK